jgi:hypothetical protein
MGQFFNSKEKIGALSESAGTITLQDSHLLIGGQGYDTGNLDLTIGTASAGTLYMIYAVLDSGSIILVKSTNMNSVGPAGYDSWRLVSAFFVKQADTFSSFVNIEGVPCVELGYEDIDGSNFVNDEGLSMDGNLTHKIDGSNLHLNVNITVNSGTGTTASPLKLDLSTIPGLENLTYTASRHGASWVRVSNTPSTSRTPALMYVVADGTAQLQFGSNPTNIQNATVWGSTDGKYGQMSISVIIPNNEWSNTPLKDL